MITASKGDPPGGCPVFFSFPRNHAITQLFIHFHAIIHHHLFFNFTHINFTQSRNCFFLFTQSYNKKAVHAVTPPHAYDILKISYRQYPHPQGPVKIYRAGFLPGFFDRGEGGKTLRSAFSILRVIIMKNQFLFHKKRQKVPMVPYQIHWCLLP